MVVERGKNRCFGVRRSLDSTLGKLLSVSALVSAAVKLGRLWNRPRRDTGSSRVAWILHEAHHAAFREEWTLGKPLGSGWARHLRRRVHEVPASPRGHFCVASHTFQSLAASEVAVAGAPGKGEVGGGGHRGPQEKGRCRRCKIHLMTDDHPHVNVRGRLWAESGQGCDRSHQPRGQVRTHLDSLAKPGPWISGSQRTRSIFHRAFFISEPGTILSHFS